jgi:hypothetical protein
MFKIISPVIGNVASESLEAGELFLGFSTGCVVYDALGSALRGTLAPLPTQTFANFLLLQQNELAHLRFALFCYFLKPSLNFLLTLASLFYSSAIPSPPLPPFQVKMLKMERRRNNEEGSILEAGNEERFYAWTRHEQ